MEVFSFNVITERFPKISKLDKLLMCWWVFSGLTRMILEGYFVFTPEFYKQTSPTYLAEVCKFLIYLICVCLLFTVLRFYNNPLFTPLRFTAAHTPLCLCLQQSTVLLFTVLQIYCFAVYGFTVYGFTAVHYLRFYNSPLFTVLQQSTVYG